MGYAIVAIFIIRFSKRFFKQLMSMVPIRGIVLFCLAFRLVAISSGYYFLMSDRRMGKAMRLEEKRTGEKPEMEEVTSIVGHRKGPENFPLTMQFLSRRQWQGLITISESLLRNSSRCFLFRKISRPSMPRDITCCKTFGTSNLALLGMAIYYAISVREST